MSRNLFVYGSLRSGYNHSAHEYVSQHFELVGTANAKGRLYQLENFPAAVPTLDDSYLVGELYKMKEGHSLEQSFLDLDVYEGLFPEEGEIRLFRREITDVCFEGNTIASWIYWYEGDVQTQLLILSGDILNPL